MYKKRVHLKSRKNEDCGFLKIKSEFLNKNKNDPEN